MTEAPAKVHYFKDAEGNWRWNVQAQNGNILADSAEGYERVAFAVNGFHAVCRAVGGNPGNLDVEMDEITDPPAA